MIALALAASLLAPTLEAGPYLVGFRLLDVRDASRALDGRPRPLQVALWYPARATTGGALSFGDYVGLAGSQRTLGWPTAAGARAARESYRALLVENGVPPAAISAALALGLRARRDAPAAAGRFPLVVVAQGNGQSAADQAVLAEDLASHGLVVATSPSQVLLGDSMRSDADVGPSARQQALDLARVVASVERLAFVDAARVAFVGHSFGARSALLGALDEPRTAALVSLDGGIGSGNAPGWLDAPALGKLAELRVPVLHVWEDVDAFMAPSFDLLRSLRAAERTLARVRLHHRHFTSLGFLAAAVPGLDESDAATAARCVAVARLTQHFVSAALDPSAPPPAAPAGIDETCHWPAGSAGVATCPADTKGNR